MAKVTINLLPVDLYATQIKQQRFAKIQGIGVITILALVFLTSGAFALNIIQKNKLKEIESNLVSAQEAVSNLKGKEATMVTLKNRASAIEKILSTPSVRAIYNLVINLLPTGVIVDSVAVDNKNNVTLGLTTADSASVDDFMNDLISSQKNENKIKSVTVDNFSRGREGAYRVGLKIVSN